MMRNRKAPKDEEWEFVSFFDGNTETLTLTDAPHTTEDFVRSIRFVRGAVDGHRETLAIVANRNIMGGDGIPDQTTVSLTVFKLITRADNAPVGRPTHYFERFKYWRNSRQYCNSDTALAVEFGLPAPDYWPASNLPGGCP